MNEAERAMGLDKDAAKSVIHEGAPKRSFLLLIAINKYEDKRIQKLSNPVSDANRIKEALTKNYKFSNDPEFCKELYNKKVTRRDINKKLSEIKDAIQKEDDLVIFFAGHSYRAIEDKNQSEGTNPTCITLRKSPYYGTYEEADAEGFDGYLRYGDFLDKLNDFTDRCRNILLILDTCYGGEIHIAGNEKREGTKEEYQQSFLALTSGAPYQTVSDGTKGKGSPFAKNFVHLLEHCAPTKNLKCGEVFTGLQAALQSAGQIPELDSLPLIRKGKADFIFYRKNQAQVGLVDPNEVLKALFTLNFFTQQSDFNQRFNVTTHLINLFLIMGTEHCGHLLLIKRWIDQIHKYRDLDYISFLIPLYSSEVNRIVAPQKGSRSIWSLFSQASIETKDKSLQISKSEIGDVPEKVISFLVDKAQDKDVFVFFELSGKLPYQNQLDNSIEENIITFWKKLTEELSRPDYIKKSQTSKKIYFLLLDKRGPETDKIWKTALSKIDYENAAPVHMRFIDFKPLTKIDGHTLDNWEGFSNPRLANFALQAKTHMLDAPIQPSVAKFCENCGFANHKSINPYLTVFDNYHLIKLPN